jgi:hypothetical protein
MSDTAVPRSQSPLRRARWVLLLLLVPLVLGALAIDTRPRVANPGPPDTVAAERTLAVAESLRTLVDTEGAAGSWSVREDELNAVLSAAQRVAPGLVGAVRVGDDALEIDASAGAPLLPAGLWANLHLSLAESEDGLKVAEARLGRLPLPPALALLGLRLALDRALGAGMGAAAIDSVSALRLAPPAVTVALRFDADGRAPFFARLRERAFSGAGSEAREEVYHQVWFLDRAQKAGELPRKGTVLPYLRKVVETAGRRGGDEREAMRGALYALALYCGSADFGQVIGVALPDYMQGGGNGCERTHLGLRDDLKRHFALSAGLYAVTTSGQAAFGVGELKELLDADAGGSGFSFDDMAADAAGVRFAEAFLAAPRSAWPRMLAGITAEADVLPSLDGLPEGLDATEFRARYGSVDSPAYTEAVAEIERRVNTLPLHAGPE